MKLAIHNRSGSYSDFWINYCIDKNISYKIVNCFDSDIISQLDDCDALMWHWAHWDYKAILFARQLALSLEQAKKKVFPDSNTCWHFDDKLGQKYLFEALKIAAIPTWVFYDKHSANQWATKAEFPKVFKLRGGASSVNVKLIRTQNQAHRLIKKAFGKGFEISNKWNIFKDRLIRFKREKSFNELINVGKGTLRLFIKNDNERLRSKDKGYIYIQDFIPGNTSDIRLVVVGNHCFGMRRFLRNGDFRASGSGLKDYNHKLISKDCVDLAFNTARKLNMQSVAFDFIRSKQEFKLIEISYAFVSTIFPGYWDPNLIWHEGKICPQKVMIEDFVKLIINKTI